MRTQNVTRRSKRIGYLIILGTILPIIGVPVLLCPIQQLPKARIGLTGQVDGPIDRPVTLTAQLPQGYGLTASERRAGLPELNDQHRAEAVLDGITFEIQLPPARYCIHRFWWQEMPPPPVWLTLRFSDAPGEEYVVWATERGAAYIVREADGAQRSKDRANWRLHPGAIRFRNPETADRVWLLELRLERLRHRTPPSGGEPANA